MLTGKGMYIWMIRYTLNGNVKAIADRMEEAGMTHAWIKVADGPGRYNIDPFNVDRVPGLIAELRMRGIACWGWQYVYGIYPELEAAMAIRRIRELDLDGFVVNAEVEYKKAGAAKARTYMIALRTAFRDLPIGLSSYRFPSYHADFPFDAFLDFCDFNSPQVYWMGAHNAGEQLRRSVNEFKNLVKIQRPIFPTGAAFQENGWEASADEVNDFMQTCQDLKLAGFNFWEVRNCWMNLPDVWEEIKKFDWNSPPVSPPTSGGDEEISGLKARVVSQMVNVRVGPGVQHADIGDLTGGDEVPVLDIGGTDCWIKIGEDPEQWIAKRTGGRTYAEVVDG